MENMSKDNPQNTKLDPAICTQCGGPCAVDPSHEKAICKYCGTSFFVKKAINNYNEQHVNVERVESMNLQDNKRGAVESVLNFIEKQQDKKQKKIDEEKRRLEEEKRKQEEQRQKIINQIFNKKYRKRNLIIIGTLAILILILSIIGATREKPSHEGEARTPSGSTLQQGKDYKDVVSDFEDRGFINIKTETLDDLIFGWLTKDGEVESVSVDGDVEYSPGHWYPNDVEVIITYHTFPADEDEEVAESSTPESLVEAVPTETTQPTKTAKPTQTTQPTRTLQPTKEKEIITVDNNDEFAAVLNTKDPGDQIIKEFALKYAGRIIEFDGNIAYMSNHGDYNTRYDFLISPWDYSTTSVSGPNFKFEDCNVFDLNLIGDNVPDAIGIGDNLHLIAKIIKYDETSQLFYLDPISTEVR